LLAIVHIPASNVVSAYSVAAMVWFLIDARRCHISRRWQCLAWDTRTLLV